jgi:hypothetical protein
MGFFHYRQPGKPIEPSRNTFDWLSRLSIDPENVFGVLFHANVLEPVQQSANTRDSFPDLSDRNVRESVGVKGGVIAVARSSHVNEFLCCPHFVLKPALNILPHGHSGRLFYAIFTRHQNVNDPVSGKRAVQCRYVLIQNSPPQRII